MMATQQPHHTHSHPPTLIHTPQAPAHPAQPSRHPLSHTQPVTHSAYTSLTPTHHSCNAPHWYHRHRRDLVLYPAQHPLGILLPRHEGAAAGAHVPCALSCVARLQGQACIGEEEGRGEGEEEGRGRCVEALLPIPTHTTAAAVASLPCLSSLSLPLCLIVSPPARPPCLRLPLPPALPAFVSLCPRNCLPPAPPLLKSHLTAPGAGWPSQSHAHTLPWAQSGA